ncbi:MULTISPECIES: GGDEF/HDGYP domain-containing response regulator [unclassified Ruminococcus]|uniref:GGDEF/HDGYP domain-containing response regulator n=1 Tax=unclassified Ruminococcus TaxID=2608920 RepID=UPI0018A9DFF6|nr:MULTISPECIES: diguanylate cyclase [unclassified Ruminococcus]MDB8776707.1 response regulator [Ruminococcus sp. 1001136sp1]
MSEVITKQKILIADDSEMNRELLAAILEEEYDIIQVNDGVQAVDCLQRQAEEISLLLLDIVMPHMDGFEVLSYMNKEHWIDAIPVVIISSENSPIYIKRGYDLGATDFIGKPFDANMVLRRSANAILLGAKQRRMTSIVSNQIYEREKSSKLMINILSHIVEFRNGESGLHVLHIQTITEMLLRQLVQKENNRYALSKEQIRMITTASALHDIGKISIPDEILNKPGRLTAEEFAVIKGHSMAGANMLSELPLDQKEEPLVKTAYEICRWHHERYDGGGYPDGLKGEEIPVSAQVVALADVYDALTSERCYKDAYSHEKAIEMILAGQCGAFNPLMLECLLDISSSLKKKMGYKSKERYEQTDLSDIASRFHDFEMDSSEKIVQQLEFERMRYNFLAEGSRNIVFTYTISPPLLTFNQAGCKRSGITEPSFSPLQSGVLKDLVEEQSLKRLIRKITQATRETPDVTSNLLLTDGKNPCHYRCQCRVIWTDGAEKGYTGVVGKLTDITDDYMVMENVREEGLKVLEKDRSAEFSSFYDRFKKCGFSTDGTEAWLLLQYLQISYDLVRYVDPITNKVIHIEKDGKMWESETACSDIWNCLEKCSNCISRLSMQTRKRMTKLEVAGDDPYQVVSMYVEIDGKPCCLEMASRLDGDFMPDGYSRDEILSSVRIHKEKVYIDPVTGVYNKRYYVEKLSKMDNAAALMFADIKNFKRINENFGHQAGDDVLRQVAGVLRDVAAGKGDVLRYSGDDFVTVFFKVTEEELSEIQKEMCRRVEALRFPELPGVQLKLVTAGTSIPGRVEEMLEQVRI